MVIFLEAIAELLGLEDSDDGGLALPGGGPAGVIIITAVSPVVAVLAWLWLW